MMGGGGELPWATALLLNIAGNLTANMAALGLGLGGVVGFVAAALISAIMAGYGGLAGG